MPFTIANGRALHYALDGPDDAPVVVFSNSLGTSLEMWDPQLPALSGQFRCLRYDTRGHGRSATCDAPMEIDDLAADLLGLLDTLAIERPHLVGLSLGGMTAQAFAAAHPDRVDRLVLLATAAQLGPPAMWDERAALVRSAGMGAVVDAVLSRCFTRAFAADPAALRARAQLLATDPIGYARACGTIRDMDLRPRLPAIAAPTLVVAGAADTATPPAMGEALRMAIPGAELVVVPGAAHLLNIEQPAHINRHLLGFLTPDAGVPPRSEAFAAGLANRRSVLGDAHVARALATAGSFGASWQDFITRYAWNEVWGDDTLPRKTRSLVTLALMIALNREEEFKLHVRPALRNGVLQVELRALLTQTAVYVGVPAANGAFRWLREELGAELD